MNTDPAFGNWLAGFIDGEGCFAINKAVRKPAYFRCQFSLRVRLDDAAIVREVHKRLGFGSVFTAKANGPTNPSFGWSVSSRPDALKLAELLETYPLRAKKARDFAIWRLALDEWRGANDRALMAHYKEALHEVRRYGGGELENDLPAPSQLRLISS